MKNFNSVQIDYIFYAKWHFFYILKYFKQTLHYKIIWLVNDPQLWAIHLFARESEIFCCKFEREFGVYILFSFWLGKVKGVNFDENKIAQNYFFAIFCAVFYLWCPKLIRNHIICIALYTIIEWIDRSAVFNTR